MGLHPLLDLAGDREVRQTKGFRKVASGLSGEALAEMYRQEVAAAPRRGEAGKRYLLPGHDGTLGKARRQPKDAEVLGLALVNHRAGADQGLPLPEDDEAGSIDWLDYRVPLRSKAVDKQDPNDPNQGVGELDLLGLNGDGRLVVGVIKYLPPDATRGSTGDTPLRALLEGLATCAIVDANREALAQELQERHQRSVDDQPPLLLIVGSKRYWELCRKREAQKGAAWINELERLAKEIEAAFGVGVRTLSIRLSEDPAWQVEEGRPSLTCRPLFDRAWEHGAGKKRPKPRPKEKVKEEVVIVEADLSRPPRPYRLTETYAPGDRIEHPTLGLGVVQSLIGAAKIEVLFDEQRRLLVHDRSAAAGRMPAPPSVG